MARRFSLFRRSEPEHVAEEPPAAAGETSSKGFGFVTLATDDAASSGDPDQPVIIGSLFNSQAAAEGGNSVAMEEIALAHEGVDVSDGKAEVYGFSHEVKSPPDSASPGETIQIHGQYDMDTTVEPDAGPFAMKDDAGDAPSASASLVRGEIVSIEPAFHAAELPGGLADDAIEELLD
jgi:hypothetical protein